MEKFFKSEAASGMVLLAATLIALIWANSPAHSFYLFLMEPAHFWINDGLMAIFFFVVGLEIKREMVAGELSSFKRAALPMIGAIGGMLIPALIYLAFNGAGFTTRGWAIPMATDIAFAVGVLSLFGKRIPYGLKIFLLALAIADDIGAVLVIAVFYTSQLHFEALTGAIWVVAVIVTLNRFKLGGPLAQLACALALWYCTLMSGIHPTVAGVILGLLTPVERAGALIDRLHPSVSFLIMPAFALCNAGVSLKGLTLELFSHPVFLGVSLGLLIGKALGIVGAAGLAVMAGWSQLPRGVNWRQLLAVGFLGGIGFTMALFLNQLALGGSAFEIFAKLGVLLGSFVAALVGAALLAFPKQPNL